jgi:hypothetical protein
VPKTRAKQLKLKEVDVDAAARLRLLGRASEGLMVLSIASASGVGAVRKQAAIAAL